MDNFVELVVRGLLISFGSDVYAGEPHPEDGESREHLGYYITIQDERGNCWRSLWTVTTEQFFREACERQAAAYARRVARYVAKGHHPKDSSKWVKGRPIYGSEAYIEYGQADDVRWEREQEGLH